ncbi:hypothetical protein THIOM_004321 [Candidatus Thiomargarita nelsonii]|uniref:Uncharacterized protein n=1 Tax=Candidatus Thiomargarita nelsonii TaxID=1003181 RepID=A0A0A6RHI5_9GAMM|nr:hypothetical protein THIOM_004321 [Candidatus Thiomargarita nelsonii]
MRLWGGVTFLCKVVGLQIPKWRGCRHLKAFAFITLNQKAVVDVMYADGDFQCFWGFRLLAVDGSKTMLPNTPASVGA